ncbi:cyclin Pas1 [Schizosaccharomyces pombe]|uniref:G1/S-specific cyclin pas1 n=1 Tax=Schizosaccharomyces pombe (strain 972 / ATCC 24843) TaxID=284812 RepID=CGP1_SCHPO|nr:cyclin Pas1 [Schizosaccharomyces pombe]P87049.3 RecName: Full=G1/S-specific cyclin pas1 [Schizosaccharomyces pombe 972h-]BAB16401.1 Pcl-like cyclin Pas1 [Schizosaccharomyces pombe]CAC35180.2 cyclin Pas1 [Schizosaccharomyces pombe]|eukprot:NP_001342984.1 cyclin Pas1 [Schizosaccharomyces pombe]
MSKVNMRALLESFSTVILSIYPLAKSTNQQSHSHSLSLTQFLYETIRRSRVDYTTLLLALYYFIRFRDAASSKPTNYIPLLCGRRLFLVCLMAATKFLQDRSFSNRAWSRLSGLPVDKLLVLEYMFYQCIDYRLVVPKHIFARWSLLVGECCAHATARYDSTDPNVASFGSVAQYWVSLFSNVQSSLDDLFSIACLTKIAHRRMNANAALKNQATRKPSSSPQTTQDSSPILTMAPSTPVSVGSTPPSTPSVLPIAKQLAPMNVCKAHIQASNQSRTLTTASPPEQIPLMEPQVYVNPQVLPGRLSSLSKPVSLPPTPSSPKVGVYRPMTSKSNGGVAYCYNAQKLNNATGPVTFNMPFASVLPLAVSVSCDLGTASAYVASLPQPCSQKRHLEEDYSCLTEHSAKRRSYF